MSKFFIFFKKYEEIKKPIQWFIYIILIGAFVSTILGVIFGFKSCESNSTIETVEAKYFMNEIIKV